MSNKIINFHDVNDIDWFEKTLAILMEKYEMVALSDVENFFYHNEELKNVCHITIDDGDMTFYKNIYPVLKKYKVPATIFVSPKICSRSENFWFQEIRDYNQDKLRKEISKHFDLNPKLIIDYPVGMILKNCKIEDVKNIIVNYQKRNETAKISPQNMSVEQLIEIDREGLITIGAHTLDHPILANECEENSQKEIHTSINELEEILGHEIIYFAYPNGIPELDFGQREMDFLEQKKIRLSFSTEGRNFNKQNNPLSIPRFGFSFGSEPFVKAKLFMGAYWEDIRKIKSKDEKTLRKDLKNKIVLIK